MKERRFQGIAASGGVAIAPAFLFSQPLDASLSSYTASGNPEEELARLKRALDKARAEIQSLYASAKQRVGEQEAEIFKVHTMFLQDLDESLFCCHFHKLIFINVVFQKSGYRIPCYKIQLSAK